MSYAVLPAIVAAEQDNVARNQRRAMKLGTSAIMPSVIRPASLAGGLVHPVDEPVAGAKNDGLPHDRRGGVDSAPRVVAP
jgi:hypothetical protein